MNFDEIHRLIEVVKTSEYALRGTKEWKRYNRASLELARACSSTETEAHPRDTVDQLNG
jgi:hypothetical protein